MRAKRPQRARRGVGRHFKGNMVRVESVRREGDERAERVRGDETLHHVATSLFEMSGSIHARRQHERAFAVCLGNASRSTARAEELPMLYVRCAVNASPGLVR